MLACQGSYSWHSEKRPLVTRSEIQNKMPFYSENHSFYFVSLCKLTALGIWYFFFRACQLDQQGFRGKAFGLGHDSLDVLWLLGLLRALSQGTFATLACKLCHCGVRWENTWKKNVVPHKLGLGMAATNARKLQEKSSGSNMGFPKFSLEVWKSLWLLWWVNVN